MRTSRLIQLLTALTLACALVLAAAAAAYAYEIPLLEDGSVDWDNLDIEMLSLKQKYKLGMVQKEELTLDEQLQVGAITQEEYDALTASAGEQTEDAKEAVDQPEPEESAAEEPFSAAEQAEGGKEEHAEPASSGSDPVVVAVDENTTETVIKVEAGDINSDQPVEDSAAAVSVVVAGSDGDSVDGKNVDVSVGSISMSSESSAGTTEGVDIYVDGASSVSAKTGDITLTGDSATNGVVISGENKADIEISGGDITVESGDGGGVAMFTNSGSEAEAEFGDITVTGSMGAGIAASEESEVELETGNISVTGDSSTGFYVLAQGGSEAEAEAEGIRAEGKDAAGLTAVAMDGSDVDVEIGEGGVTAEGENAAAIIAQNVDSEMEITNEGATSGELYGAFVYNLSENDEAKTKILLENDLTGDQAAYIYNSGEKAAVELVVDGTIRGETAPIRLDGDNADGITIVAWQIEPNKDGALIESTTDEGATWKQDKDAEKEIRYIIRIAQPDIISTAGTESFGDYQVAGEGDTVYVKLKVPSGMRISGVWQNEGRTVRVIRGKDGQYYLEVPRGGGVTLSVSLARALPYIPATVTYHPHGGKINDSEEPVVINTCVYKWLTLPRAPEFEGRTFVGWYGSPYSPDDPEWVEPDLEDPAVMEQIKEPFHRFQVADTIVYTAIWTED